MRASSASRSYADGSHEPVHELVFRPHQQEDGTLGHANADWH